MAGIGQYIHYTARGYINHGVTQKGAFQAYKSQKATILQKVRANARTSLNSQEQKDLESVLEAMIKQTDNSNPYITRAQKVVEDKMQKLFGEALGDIYWGTGDITMSSTAQNYAVGSTKASALNIDAIVRKMDALEQSLAKQIQAGDTSLAAVKKQVNELKQRYKTTAQQIVQEAQKLNIPITKAESQWLGGFRKELNNLIKEYAAYPAIALQKGTFFEHLIAQAPVVAQHNALTAAGKVVGDAVEQVKINSLNFSPKYLTKQFTKDVLETTNVSQGKIDVQIQWNGKNVGISAKNVNLNNRYIKLLSNSSLLFLLSDEPPVFVNHALNILASHRSKDDDAAAKASIQGMRAGIIEELRLIIFYKALIGDVGSRKTANLFVVNDNKTGTVKVHDVNSILDNIQNSLTHGIAVKGVTQGMSNFKNNWNSGDPAARISELLADVHSRKISVSLNTSML